MAMFYYISDWLAECSQPPVVWYAKRLFARDTLAKNKHLGGTYIPRDFLFSVFPSLNRPEAENPDVRFDLCIDSHPHRRKVRAVWYNNRLRGGTRDEARLTNLGDSSSALLDPESTGALAIFAFVQDEDGTVREARVWVCRTVTEEELAEDIIGWPVEFDRSFSWTPDSGTSLVSPSASEDPFRPLPRAWRISVG